MKDGLLLNDKPAGCTSHDVVQQARRLMGQRKIGHCGTLDPTATGLLVLTLGGATRLTRFLIQAPKVYQGTIRFGIETDSYDAAGEVVAERSTAGLNQEAIAAIMAELTGTLDQLPPRFSAKKIHGQKYYELARRGEEVPQESKAVTVFEFSPQGELAEDQLSFRLSCSSGTYARTLAHDLGTRLGCGAHLCQLRRLQVGPFKVDDAATIAVLQQRAAERPAEADAADLAWLGTAWVPFDRIPLPFGEVVADAQQELRVQQGQTVLVRDLPAMEGDWVKLVNRRQRFIAVGTVIERIGHHSVGVIQPRVVFK